MRLTDEILDAGNHSVEFSADNMTSGVYFIKLQSSANIQTIKTLLLR